MPIQHSHLQLRLLTSSPYIWTIAFHLLCHVITPKPFFHFAYIAQLHYSFGKKNTWKILESESKKKNCHLQMWQIFLLCVSGLAHRRLWQGAGGSVYTWTVLRRRQLHHSLQLQSWRTSGTHHLHVVRNPAKLTKLCKCWYILISWFW